MLYQFAQYGGTLRLGPREFPVVGRTYRCLAMAEGYLLSLGMDQVDELRRLLHAFPHLRQEKFIAGWLRSSRLGLADFVSSGKAKFASSLLGLRFDLTLSLNLSLDELDSLLDDLGPDELRNFFREASRKLEIASGRDEMGAMGSLMRLRSVGDGGGSSIEQVFASICSNLKWPLSEILSLTPSVLSTLLSDTKFLADDLEMEQIIPIEDEGDVEAKRLRKIYASVAKNLINGHRIDHGTT